jgi:gas vesicle protein
MQFTLIISCLSFASASPIPNDELIGGAVTGAVVGGAINGLRTMGWRGALAGAGVGGVFGGTAGLIFSDDHYYDHHEDHEHHEAQIKEEHHY